MAADDLVVAMTGASGTPYGLRLLEVLLQAGRTVHLTISPAGAEVLEQETDRRVNLADFRREELLGQGVAGINPNQLLYHHHRDFRARIASRSFLTSGMVI